MEDKDKRARMRRIAGGILDLPTLPTVVAKIVELVDNPRTDASTLSRLIASDPALTARMLKLANSAYYGFPRRIGTINLAIVVLGFNTVRDLAVSASLVDRLNMGGPAGMGMSDFWEHSVSTAIAARMIQRECGHRAVGEAFVAGLLHDIGRLVIARYVSDEHERITQALEDGKNYLWVIEHQVLGMSHAEVGGMLVRRWNLPDSICDAISMHHHPMEMDRPDMLTGIVHVAEHLAHLVSDNPQQEGPLRPPSEEVISLLGLRRNEAGQVDLDWYRDRYEEELQRAETFRSLVLGREVED